MRAGTAAEAGIDFNYGAARDLQLTATSLAGYNDTVGGGARVGLGNVELAAKYRFLHQDGFVAHARSTSRSSHRLKI